jgi:hypothetical protein
MNARWLLQLDDDDSETRERVRERLWDGLMEELPYEAVRAALAASRLGNHRLRRTLERLLLQAAHLNEAVWWELYEALPSCRRATLELTKRILADFFEAQLPQRRLELLLEALERQKDAPTLGYSRSQEGTGVRLALVFSLMWQWAQTAPSIELRSLLEPLKRFPRTLAYTAPELADKALGLSALIESATRALKDLPLPASAAPTATDLPLPATAQDMDGSETEKEETNLWKQLKSKFRS